MEFSSPGIITNEVWRQVQQKLKAWLEKSPEERQEILNKKLLAIFVDEILNHKKRHITSMKKLLDYYEGATATAAYFMPPTRRGHNPYMTGMIMYIFNMEECLEKSAWKEISYDFLYLRINSEWTNLMLDLKKPRRLLKHVDTKIL